MKTIVLWTHYDCEVYASLHPPVDAAYRYLAGGWLEDCNEDNCGHDEDIQSKGPIGEIADALEYHFDELSYDINEMEVPMSDLPTTAERIIENSKQLEQKTSAPITVTEEQAGGLLSALESFSHE